MGVLGKVKDTALYQFVRKTAFSLTRIFPIDNNKVVFDNFAGRGFGDDPKYIAEELAKRNKNLKLYWLTADFQGDFPNGVIPVRISSLKSTYHLSTAKVWVDNVKLAHKPKKKKNQFYIQTWHSTLGLKKNEADVPTLLPSYIEEAQNDASQTDLMYSDNDFRFEKYKNHYWYSGPVIKCDVPRVGFIKNAPKEVHDKVKNYFGIPADKKIAVYVPTFRKDKKVNILHFDHFSVAKALSEKFGGEYCFITRLHRNNLNDNAEYEKNIPEDVYNGTFYSDIGELLAAADVCITDYSACMFDCMFAEKPVFLYTPDADEYLNNDRGVVFGEGDLPFGMSRTCDEMIKEINDFSFADYSEKCEQFKQKIGFVDSGNGSQMIADIILDVLSGKEAFE